MKNPIFLIAMLFLGGGASAQKTTYFDISDDEVAKTAQTPNEVYELVGRNGQKKPTWALIETNGESSGASGHLKKIYSGKVADTYTVADKDTIALPKRYKFELSSGILYNSQGKKLEAVILEMKSCLCTPKTGLVFKDSLTVNTVPHVYKKVLQTSTDHWWLSDEGMLVPAVSAHLIDTLDSNPNGVYGLSVATKAGAVCDILWLQRDEIPGPVKHTVYVVSKREGKRFGVTKEGGYTFDGAPIKGVMVLTIAPLPKANGAIKRKHKKRARHH